MGPWRLLLLPDHATPLALKTHTSDPVPYLLVDSAADGPGGTYTERGVAECPRGPGPPAHGPTHHGPLSWRRFVAPVAPASGSPILSLSDFPRGRRVGTMPPSLTAGATPAVSGATPRPVEIPSGRRRLPIRSIRGTTRRAVRSAGAPSGSEASVSVDSQLDRSVLEKKDRDELRASPRPWAASPGRGRARPTSSI